MSAASNGVERTDRLPLGMDMKQIAAHLSELRGHAQLMVYLADQIEDTDNRLDAATDPSQRAFLHRVLAMYTHELQKRHEGLSGRISAITTNISSRTRKGLLKSIW
jgi:hypothetical protein